MLRLTLELRLALEFAQFSLWALSLSPHFIGVGRGAPLLSSLGF